MGFRATMLLLLLLVQAFCFDTTHSFSVATISSSRSGALVPLRQSSISQDGGWRRLLQRNDTSLSIDEYFESGATDDDETVVLDATTTEAIQISTTSNLPSSEGGNARARLLLLTAAALYGTNFSVVKLLNDMDLTIGASTALRFMLASLAFAPFLEMGEVGLLGFEVGVWNSLGYIAQAVGLETTEASKSAFLCSLAVVVVPILDYLTASGKPQRQQWMGVLLAVMGVGLLEVGSFSVPVITDAGVAAPNAGLATGDWISLIQPLTFGIGFWRMERAMRLYPSKAKATTASQLLGVFIMTLLYWQFIESPTNGTMMTELDWSAILHNPTLWLALGWTGLITTALTVWMETMALESLSAAETTLLLSTEPLWGTLCACLLLGESLTQLDGVGAGCIVMGCCIASSTASATTTNSKDILDSSIDVDNINNDEQQQQQQSHRSWWCWNQLPASPARTVATTSRWLKRYSSITNTTVI